MYEWRGTMLTAARAGGEGKWWSGRVMEWRSAEPCARLRSLQPLLKGVLDDRLDAGDEGAGQQAAQDAQVPRDVQPLGVHAHVDIEPAAGDLHRVAVRRPGRGLDHPAKSA